MNKEEMYTILTEQWGDDDNLVNDLLHYSKELQQENEQLKHNWYSLKMYLKEKAKPFSDFDNYDVERIINKMEELEILRGGD